MLFRSNCDAFKTDSAITPYSSLYKKNGLESNHIGVINPSIITNLDISDLNKPITPNENIYNPNYSPELRESDIVEVLHQCSIIESQISKQLAQEQLDSPVIGMAINEQSKNNKTPTIQDEQPMSQIELKVPKNSTTSKHNP